MPDRLGEMRRAAQDGSTRREEGSREWDLDLVGDMSTAEILAKLQDLGVPLTTTEFVRHAPKFPSAGELAEDWYERYPVKAPGP
jgi:hypothetical protein